ncbi:MAG: LOG family protein [bacterium]
MFNAIGHSTQTNMLSFQARKKHEKPPLDREHTVAILGTGKDLETTEKYTQMAYEVANKLAKDGYNVVTGGGDGIMSAANKGATDADAKKSFSIMVKYWPNKIGQKFFNVLSTVMSGPKRTDMFAKDAGTWIVFPGGTGTLEEIGVGTESKYYGHKDDRVAHPDKIIMVDREFQKPLKAYINGMQEMGLAPLPQNSEKETLFEELFEEADTSKEIVDKVENKKLSTIT